MFAIRIAEELTLELLEAQHADELFQLVDANRSYLRQWLPWLDQNTSVEHTRAFIEGSLRQLAARNGFACAVRWRGAIAGVTGLHAIDWANRRSSLGYWIAESQQGKGLVTRACAAILGHAFGELGLNCIEIACATRNAKSRAIPERLGFTQEAILRQREWLYDHFVDHVIYTMLASEWTQKKAPRG